jgi:hypothetical protein
LKLYGYCESRRQLDDPESRRDPVIDAIKRMAVDNPQARERIHAANILRRAVSHLQRRGALHDPRILDLAQLRAIRSLVEGLPILGAQMYADTLSAIHDLLYDGYPLQPQRDLMARLESLAEALMEVDL